MIMNSMEMATSNTRNGLCFSRGVVPSYPLCTMATVVFWLFSKAFNMSDPVMMPKEFKPRLMFE